MGTTLTTNVLEQNIHRSSRNMFQRREQSIASLSGYTR